MNPFTQMAATLQTTAHPFSFAPIPDADSRRGLNRTERIRRLLKTTGRAMTANEIAFDMDTEFPDFGVHLVWLLLKYDIAKGRVIHEGARYSWSKAYDTAQAEEIRNAVKLLKHAGYTVKAPKA